MAVMKSFDLEPVQKSVRRNYRIEGGIIPKHHNSWNVDGIMNNDGYITSTRFSTEHFETWEEFEAWMGEWFDYIELDFEQEITTTKVSKVILDKTKIND